MDDVDDLDDDGHVDNVVNDDLDDLGKDNTDEDNADVHAERE